MEMLVVLALSLVVLLVLSVVVVVLVGLLLVVLLVLVVVVVGRAKQGRRGFYYLVAAFDLISDPAAVAAGGARARGEAAAAAKAASDLPNLLLPAAPKMPEVVPRYDAQHHLGLGRRHRQQRATMPTSLGVRGGRTGPLLPKTAGWWRVAADDRKRNLFWSKPRLS